MDWSKWLIFYFIGSGRESINDPQHPDFYEGEEMWMARGFINQFFLWSCKSERRKMSEAKSYSRYLG
ncbi:hypothetical protein HanXRQr2_Chr16g0724651 [Helianthus annuus]|uniref:Uncharacterized protein n=1 Tax=Helianthus annuus TaxID=4232 RepID=A0A9K3DMH9_HELAN|nr:hypothetical protein HanXRQr2_Chr16g0724651 [Helianthus annuus]